MGTNLPWELKQEADWTQKWVKSHLGTTSEDSKFYSYYYFYSQEHSSESLLPFTYRSGISGVVYFFRITRFRFRLHEPFVAKSSKD